MAHFILYSRSYCHLCDDMLEALRLSMAPQAFSIDVIDIDLDDNLVARYDERVPVLVGIGNNGVSAEICHYFLDEAKLKAFLAAA